MRNALVGAIVAMMGVSYETMAAVNVFDSAANPAVSISTSMHSSGATNVEVTLLGSAMANGDVFIETTSNDPLGIVTLKNRSNDFDLTVRIRGAADDFSKRPASIIEIQGGSSTDNLGNIRLIQCEVVGSIEWINGINRIQDLDMENGLLFLEVNLDSASGTNALTPEFINSEIRGNVLTMVLANHGYIDNVYINGTLGNRSSEVLGLLAVDNIGTIRMDAAYGVIRGFSDFFIKKVHQIIIDDASNSGHVFQGVINVDSIEANAGIPGVISIANGINAKSAIRIKEALKIGQGQIHLPASGLAGHIVIGADGSPGDWAGDVFVGATTLGDAYSETAAALGGGAAGAVPFKPHLSDSIPEFGSHLAFTSAPVTPEYLIRHYGRVYFDDQVTSPHPIRIFRRARCVGASWLDITDVWQFEYEVPEDAAVDGAPSTVVNMHATTSGYYRNGFEYFFSNEKEGSDRLVCYLDLSASEVVVDSYPGDPWFSVGSACPWDITGDDNTNIDDLNALLADWNASGNNLAGDINGTGACDIDDLNILLTHWNETTCQGCTESFGIGGGENSMMNGFFSAGELFNDGDLLVSQLGYATVEDFCADLASMNAEEQDAMLTALGVAAEQ